MCRPAGAAGGRPRATPLPPRPAELGMLDRALQLLKRAAQMPGDRRRSDALGDPAEQARAGDAVAEAELDVGAPGADLAQPPAPALVQAGDARPRHVAGLVELDDLDEA